MKLHRILTLVLTLTLVGAVFGASVYADAQKTYAASKNAAPNAVEIHIYYDSSEGEAVVGTPRLPVCCSPATMRPVSRPIQKHIIDNSILFGNNCTIQEGTGIFCDYCGVLLQENYTASSRHRHA